LRDRSIRGADFARADSRLPAVLIVDESDPGSPFSSRFRDQINATLNAGKARRYTAYLEFLDSGHLTESDFEAALRTSVIRKYTDKSITVIIALGSGALKFSTQIRAQISPSAPIVFVLR
jgi:hypothetical protein